MASKAQESKQTSEKTNKREDKQTRKQTKGGVCKGQMWIECPNFIVLKHG